MNNPNVPPTKPKIMKQILIGFIGGLFGLFIRFCDWEFVFGIGIPIMYCILRC